MQIRVLAFHWLLVGKATEAMLTNELYGLCGRDVLLWKGSMGRKIHSHKTDILQDRLVGSKKGGRTLQSLAHWNGCPHH